MTLPRYSTYRESYLPWIDSAPEHWMASKLGHYFDEKPCYGVLVPDFELGGIPMIRITDMRNGKVKIEDLTTISSVLSAEYSRTIVRRGDVLLSVVGTIGEVVHVDEDLEGVNLSRAVARIQVDRTHLEPKFLGWLLQSKVFSTYVDLVCVGSAQRVLNMGDLCAFATALPSMKEQSAITTFLDRETAKIDALIAEQEKLIALLAEKRQATISRAVTSGLDPNVPLKDSGVPWLGKVPAHWEVLAFQRCVDVAEGQVNPEEEPYRSMILVAPNHVESGTGRLLFTETAEEQSAESGKYLCQSGDVIYSKIRPALRKVCIAPQDCLCSADMYPLSGSVKLNNDFLMWFMLSEPFSALAVLESERVAMPKINRESLKAVSIALPPKSEQMAVVEFLVSETGGIDALVEKVKSAIELLKERRAALISAAVTGKIDVRGLAA